MRKNFKFLTGALGLLALASCSTDDLQGVKGGEYDYSNKIVMHVTVQPDNEGDDMRAFVSDGGANYTWVAGDKLRAYDGKLQAYDEFTVLGNAFVLPIDEAVIEDPADYAYVVKAEEGNISFAGWNNKKNLALVRLGWEVADGTATQGITYEETTEYSEDGTVQYRTAVPLYGFPTITRGEGDEIDLEVSLARLTSQAKVVFENGSNSGARAVRARSLKLRTSHNVTIAQLLEIANAAKGDNVYPVFDELTYNTTVFTDLLEANETTPMSGWFQAELDMDAESTSKLQPVEDNTGAINTEINEAEIVVNIPEQSMQEYTNVIYLPIVSQLYDLLIIEYQGADNKWHYLAGRANVTPPTTGTMDAGVVTSSMSATVATFEDLQAVINRAAKVGADVEVAVTITADLDVPESGKLYLPANLTHHVTLNIVGQDGKYIGGRSGDADVKIVNEEGATGELTFNNAKFFGGVTVDVKDAKLGLDGEIRTTFAVTSADTLKLGTMNFSSTQLIAPLNLGETPVVIEGNVTLGTTGLGIVTTDDVIVKGTGKAYTIVNAKNITLEKGAVANALIASNDVTVDSAKVNNYITVSEGTVTIDNEEAEGQLNMEIPVINVTGNGKIVLNNGFVKKITNAVKGDDGKYTATDITIESAGKSAIIIVDSVSHATITSTWDGEYHKYMTSNGTYGDYVKNGYSNTGVANQGMAAVYTATQLANAVGSRTTTLYADITLNETANGTNLWKGLANRTRQLRGNGHIVKNVVLDVENGAKGFINELSISTTTAADVTVTNLTIDGLKAEGALADGTGALVGKVTTAPGNDITLSGVTIKNASLNGDGTTYGVGGLVGRVDGNGKLIVTGTSVDAIVEGYYNLGVVLGYIGSVADVTLGDANNKVTVDKTSAINITKEFAATTTSDTNAGKVGIVVGVLNGKLNLANFTSNLTSSSIDTNAWRYDLCNIRVLVTGEDNNQKRDLYFKGGYGPNKGVRQYFVGYSPAASTSEKYKKGEIVQTSCYDGTATTYTAPEEKKAVYNVFE